MQINKMDKNAADFIHSPKVGHIGERDFSHAPYFHARKVGDHFETTGLSSCFLGHKLPRPNSAKPDGVFAEWSWDGSRLCVRNDRYGFYPLYYYTRDGEIALSPSIARLLALGAPPEFDEAGLAVFLRLGFFIGEDTPFRAIRAVPPEAKFEWREGQLQVSGQLALGKPQPQQLKRDQAIDAYIALFEAAIRRRLPEGEDFAVPLSGGRDSRHILLELCKLDFRPKFCVTAQSSLPLSSQDVEMASKLAKALNVEHVVLDQSESILEEEIRKNYDTHFCTDEHTWFLPIAYYLKGKVRTVYDGIGGDVLSEAVSLTAERLALFESGRFTALAEHFFNTKDAPSHLSTTDLELKGGASCPAKVEKERATTSEIFLAHLLPPEQYRRLGRDLAVSHLVPELRRHANAPNPVGSFRFWNRTRREIALSPYGILSEVPHVFSPYVDHDLYDFLTSLPPSILLNREFHTETIRRAYPSYAHIPYASETSSVENPRLARRFARDTIRYTLARRPSRTIRYSYVMPRLLRCLLDRHYSSSIFWLSPPVLYLLQLETLARGGSVDQLQDWHIGRFGQKP